MIKTKGEILINSREYDELFTDLIASLEACSRANGICEKCPLYEDCIRAYDALMNKTHYKLDQSDVEQFRDKFLNFKKQLSLC